MVHTLKSFREPERRSVAGGRIFWVIVLASVFALVIMEFASPTARADQANSGKEKVWRSALIDMD